MGYIGDGEIQKGQRGRGLETENASIFCCRGGDECGGSEMRKQREK